MKRFRSSLFSALIAAVMLFSFMSSSALALSVSNIKSIQAYTGATFYGQGVVKVEVTYNSDVDLSGVTVSNYVLEDRGSLIPDFGSVPIASVDVSGQVVTLNIDITKSAATDNNVLIYSGDSAEGSRERNVFGIYPTGPWFRDVDGNIHYGSGDDTKGYLADTTPSDVGYQTRKSLELRLYHSDDAPDAALCLADEYGAYTDADGWLPTIDDLDGFLSLYDLQIESTANTNDVTDGTGDDYVRGYYKIPDNYNPANGIVFTLQGQGISYWQLEDGTNNAGTGFYYDSSTRSWADKGAIVVNIHDRSSAAMDVGTDWWDVYDFIVDDVNVMKYFIDTYNITGPIVITGNSRGTLAASMVIKALAGQEYHPHNQNNSITKEETYSLDTSYYNFTIDTYICQNGQFGYEYDDDDWNAVAATGLRVWAIEGEQDSFSNVESIATYTALTTELYGEEWVAENVRLTCHNSEIYYRWGESDHSTTRINGYYFANAAFYGPDCYVDNNGEIVYNTKLGDGDTYELLLRGRAASQTKNGYQYTIYDESYQTWALNAITRSGGGCNAGIGAFALLALLPLALRRRK